MTAAIAAGVLAAIALALITWRIRGSANLHRAEGAAAPETSVAATLASLEKELDGRGREA